MRFLIIEDNIDLAHAIERRLKNDGHVIELAQDLATARDFLSVSDFDFLLLDVNLPDGLGFSLLESLRAQKNHTPILILTARPAIDDKIDALDLGADDYVVKPFDMEELIARIRAILRRASGEGETVLHLGNLSFSPRNNQAQIENEPLNLTKSELRALEVLLMQKGRVLSKDQLLDRLYSLDEEVSHNALELIISRLRKKIAPSNIEIKALRGLGYQLIMSNPCE